MAFMAIKRAGRFTGSVHGSPEAGSLFERNCPAFETAPAGKDRKERGGREGLIVFYRGFLSLKACKVRLALPPA